MTTAAVSGFALCLRTPSTSAPCRTMPAFSSCCHWRWSWMSQISYTWNSTVLVDSHFRPLCHNMASLHCPVLGGCQLTKLQNLQSWSNSQLILSQANNPQCGQHETQIHRHVSAVLLSNGVTYLVRWMSKYLQHIQENMLGED